MTIHYQDDSITLHHGQALDVLRTMPDASVGCCVTSPPYFGLRDYGVDGQLGAEKSPAEYVAALVAVMAEVRRVLADDGTLWLNLGDSYVSKPPGNVRGVSDRSGLNATGFGIPEKNLLMIPPRCAIALQDDGWILRNDIIWAKPNGMPESVTDRLSTKHEHLFLFAKSRRYFFNLDPIRDEPVSADDSRPQLARAKVLAAERGITEQHVAAMRAVGMSDAGKARTTQDGTGKNRAEVQALADEAKRALGGYYREFLTTQGRNPGDVWTIPTRPFSGAHFATFPQELPRRCIAAGAKPGSTVLDPFSGSGTTGLAAGQLGHPYIGIDINAEYLDLSLSTRLAQSALIDEGQAS